MQSTFTRQRRVFHVAACHSLAFAALQVSINAKAVELPSPIPELKLQWDNTVKYSAAARLRNPSSTLTSPAVNSANANLDDGDRNFDRGLISNRFDILSEFDAKYHEFGLRVSGAAWYDDVYNRRNDNPGFPGGAFPNQESVPANKFVATTRRVEGRDIEVLDAFAYGSFNLDDDRHLSFRAGRHAMVWGETFFFGANGIAGGMMPVDVVKLISVPNTQFKEAIRPVPMLSGQLQLTSETAVGAYYQLQWVKSRTPTVGSYFSVADTLPDGAEQLLLVGPGSPFLANAPREADERPRNSGQGGLQLRSQFGQTDVGAYLIRYHDKTPQEVNNIGAAPVAYTPGAGCVIPGSFPTGPTSCALPGPVSYRLVYPEDITSVGFSASRTFESINLASEVSFRDRQALNAGGSSDASALTAGPATNNSGNPGYPVARTAHANVSAIWTIDPNELFRESTFVGEIGWNRVMHVIKNVALVDSTATRSAVAFRGIFSTTHRQVLAGLDVSPSIGLGWAPHGSRSPITSAAMPQNGNGDATLGFDFTYQDAWRASLSATHYFGSAGSFLTARPSGGNELGYKQYYADRDFVAFSLRHSF